MQHSGKQYVVRWSAIRIPAIRASTAGFPPIDWASSEDGIRLPGSERESSTPTRRRPLQAFLASSWWQMVWPNPLRRTNTPLTLWRSLNGIKVLDRSHQSQFLPSSVTARRRSFSGIESRMPRQNWHGPSKTGGHRPPLQNTYGALQKKFEASSMLPVPLYLAT